MPIDPHMQDLITEDHDLDASRGAQSTPPVDLMPALRKKNGTSLHKSGDRLAADLQTARDGVVQMITIIDTKLPPDKTGQTELLRATLHRMLAEIDGVDPQDPPIQEALDLFSHRAKLIATAIRLIIQRHIADDLSPGSQST